MVAAGVAAPLVRKRVKAPPALVQSVAFCAPLGLSIALPRSRTRDVAVCTLQMWAYLSAYKSTSRRCGVAVSRVRIDYPIAIDRVLGLGELPTLRLQRALASESDWRSHDRVLVWAHWIWFFTPTPPSLTSSGVIESAFHGPRC